MKALPGNPYDSHTLKAVIPDIEALIGKSSRPSFPTKAIRGHNAPLDYKFEVFTSGQKRRGAQDQTRTAPPLGH
ncbi:hypothetical protein IVA78_29100 [Bradyrhizobium sp. 137]|uniref:hypothetical protein n=1 Tax=Bradyrhizobium sp. 137 TaxID=2782614 RepID=UPI001FFB5BB2|nr:hypothetical protein [Bradyrhizobium sp. 137]MCK1759106.1 hypothetical protein [Bradyrhizobium sp. 137]